MGNSTQSCFIATCNRGFSQHGQEELRKLFASVRCSGIVPAEMFRFDVGMEKSEALSVLKSQEPVFVRHIHPIDRELHLDGTDADLARLQEAVLSLEYVPNGRKIAVQTRKLEGVELSYSPFDCKAAIDEILVNNVQAVPVIQHAEFIISILLMPHKAYVGIATPDDNLSDWSGGAVRFQKEEGQVSRAKFKLLEAEQRFGLDFSEYRNALDIGAAPGGWTSLLLERGCSVTAVDPAKLDPRIVGHPKLKYLSRNASDVTFAKHSFDLLVCDMSWSPRQMTKLVKDLLYALQPGGTAIVTVKLMHKKPFQTIRETIQDLSPDLRLLKAKQLFHNREELTLCLIKG